MSERKWLPTLGELVDRLSIHQLKEIFIPENKDNYGKEINDETYAICKSDMMIKGNNPENIKVGSTLSSNEFVGKHFDYMLSNPPYGKSWANEKQ